LTHDPDPDDTSVETIIVYMIRSGGELHVEYDRHITGLFSLSTWIRLMNESGFSASLRSFHLEKQNFDYKLITATLTHS